MMRAMHHMLFLGCLILALSNEATAQGDKGAGSASETPAAVVGNPETTATPADSPTGETPPVNAAAAAEVEQGAYAVRLRDLEDRVNRLKEQIFRSKARLSLLAETVLDRKIAGARTAIVFRNEMGGSFRLNKATILLDGGPIFNQSDEGEGLSSRSSIDLFDGPVMPGDHTLSIILHYKGHGYGIFSYLKGYAFKTKSTHTFTVNEGKMVTLDIVGYEKGGVTTPLEERPAVRYVEAVSEYESKDVNTGPAAGGQKK